MNRIGQVGLAVLALALGARAETYWSAKEGAPYPWNPGWPALWLSNSPSGAHHLLLDEDQAVVSTARGLLSGAIALESLEEDPPPLPPEAPASGKVNVTLAWDPSPDADVTRYRVYWGPERRHYFAATALASNGLESEYSQEVGGEPVVVVWAEAATNAAGGQWTRWTNWTEAVARRAELPPSLYLKLRITNEWR